MREPAGDVRPAGGRAPARLSTRAPDRTAALTPENDSFLFFLVPHSRRCEEKEDPPKSEPEGSVIERVNPS